MQLPSHPNQTGNARRNLLMRLAIAGTTLAVSITAYFSYQVVRNLTGVAESFKSFLGLLKAFKNGVIIFIFLLQALKYFY